MILYEDGSSVHASLQSPRAEGVYCHWESYPPDTPGIGLDTLVIERVNGNETVSTFECTRVESAAIKEFLGDENELA
jgi:hypothetical protein